MSRDFKNCIDKKKLYRSDAAKALAGKEFTSAGDDLAEAELSLSQRRFKWATIQAYYAMFHAARAMIYSRGYRERSHFCVVAAIEHLFGNEKLIERKWVRALMNAMSLREDADYSYVFSSEGADVSVGNAKGFLNEAKRILGGPSV
ncbi:MAG TPA: HEPN domain-containing protein [Nitrospirota bacterium]|nr:HEPN domain-containing protein [Nitrospirota bacterium]